MLAAVWLLLVPVHAGPAAGAEGTLTIKASGFRSGGLALAALFNSPDGFPSQGEKAFRSATAEIYQSSAVFVFPGLPYGSYAASVLHDENSNGRMDSTWLGLPKEGVGASRNPVSRFGPPSFKSAVFELASPEMEINIKMRYVRG